MTLDASWASVAMSVATMLLVLGRKSGTYLTRAEHDRICKERQADIQQKLAAIKEDVTEIKEAGQSRGDESRIFRAHLADKMTAVELKVALIEEREKRRASR